MTVCSQGCRRNPKYLLFVDPWDDKIWDLVVVLDHSSRKWRELQSSGLSVRVLVGVRVMSQAITLAHGVYLSLGE